jgi:hypothetical protein
MFTTRAKLASRDPAPTKMNEAAIHIEAII